MITSNVMNIVNPTSLEISLEWKIAGTCNKGGSIDILSHAREYLLIVQGANFVVPFHFIPGITGALTGGGYWSDTNAYGIYVNLHQDHLVLTSAVYGLKEVDATATLYYR